MPDHPLPRIIICLLATCLSGLSACTHMPPPAPPQLANQAPTAEAQRAMPAPPDWLAWLDGHYDTHVRVDGLEDRRFSPEHWWQVATPLLRPDAGFRVNPIGASAQGRPLRHVQWGQGEVPILLWSQMHGDESTATMALADLFHFLAAHPDHALVTRLRRHTTLHVFPLVNPDGAARFERRNAQGVDINRDARALATPEARALKALRDRVQPAYGFNLHDQRPGYRVGDSARGAAIALLAPPPDDAGEVNPIRARAMHVAATMRVALEPYIAGHISRWDDTFNPRAFGDLMTQWGTSTVLVESGGIECDPHKQALRKLNFLALVAALDAIAGNRHLAVPTSLYTTLPENGPVWPDLIIRDAIIQAPDRAPLRADIRIDFADPLQWRDGRIVEIGDLSALDARQQIPASGLHLRALAGADGAPAAIAPGAPARLLLVHPDDPHRDVWHLDRHTTADDLARMGAGPGCPGPAASAQPASGP